MAMPRFSSCCILGLMALSSPILSGCCLTPAAVIPGVAVHQHSLAETDIPELAGHANLMQLAAEVGDSLGYEVSQKSDHGLVLVYQTEEFRGMVTGEIDSLKLFVTRIESADPASRRLTPPQIVARLLEGKEPRRFACESVRLAFYGEGVYTSMRPERVQQLLDEFKNQLLARAQGERVVWGY